jgi:carbonic anhydrase
MNVSRQAAFDNTVGEMLWSFRRPCNTRLACRRVSSSFCLSKLLLAIGMAMLIILVPVRGAQEKSPHHWDYSGPEGPEHWGDLEPAYATCKMGQRQSPINIREAKKSDLPAVQFDYHASPLHIVNNGHTVQVNYAPGSFISVGENRYELKQFHFHHPSEEEINGRLFAMVIHLVHADSSGNLAVLGVLLEPGAANPVIESLWAHLPREAGTEQKFDDVRIDASGLLPTSRGYYTFTGSLTTPPCSENVSWFVLKTPLAVSREQASAFGRIYEHNVRPIQPVHDRVVLESR